MGFGLGSAVGIASVLKYSKHGKFPGRNFVLNIDGDGSFQMNLQVR